MNLRLVGDVHANQKAIMQTLKSCHLYDLTIQIGDFGVGFGAEKYLSLFSDSQFKVLHGNHDNYSLLAEFPHNLGRFGVYKFGGKKIFFVAGAFSIDRKNRTQDVSWWPDEELSYREGEDCLQLWEKECKNIDLFISHDGPPNVTQHIQSFFPKDNYTSKLLFEIWKIHNPPIWIFGHWHKSFNKKINGTMFRCLNINEEWLLEV